MHYKFIFLVFCVFAIQAQVEFDIPQTLLDQVDKGNAEAAYFIGDTYYNGSEDYKKNTKQAILWFKKSALMGNPHAMLALADAFNNEDNKIQAYEWYAKASEQGMGEAMEKIATYYYHGYAKLDKNCQTAYQWYQKAEKKGVEMAYNNHAWLLATSADTNCRNPERALKIIYDLFALYEDDDSIPWNVWDTKAAVLAAVSDFGGAIKLQKWLLEELSAFELENTNYQLHLDRYLIRSPWIDQ